MNWPLPKSNLYRLEWGMHKPVYYAIPSGGDSEWITTSIKVDVYQTLVAVVHHHAFFRGFSSAVLGMIYTTAPPEEWICEFDLSV